MICSKDMGVQGKGTIKNQLVLTTKTRKGGGAGQLLTILQF